jgi:ribonuclease D
LQICKIEKKQKIYMENDACGIINENGYYVKIPKEILNELPLVSFNGEITVIDNKEQACEVSKYLATRDILGFDTETKPSFKRGETNSVSLLQLSTGNKAFLFRLNKIGLPKCLSEILENENIIKSGVAIRDDIKTLQKLRAFKPGGFIELQSFVTQFGIEDAGLKKLTGSILGFRISKSERLSNWDLENYSEAQKRYAATDAWAGYEIYKKLIS